MLNKVADKRYPEADKSLSVGLPYIKCTSTVYYDKWIRHNSLTGTAGNTGRGVRPIFWTAKFQIFYLNKSIYHIGLLLTSKLGIIEVSSHHFCSNMSGAGLNWLI